MSCSSQKYLVLQWCHHHEPEVAIHCHNDLAGMIHGIELAVAGRFQSPLDKRPLIVARMQERRAELDRVEVATVAFAIFAV